MAVKFIVTSKDVETEEPDVSLIGGKAHALAKLGQEFPIPEWFAVTPHSFSGRGFKAEAKKHIKRGLKELGPGPYAVRSSAIDEDGSDSSFAGQLESFLNVEVRDIEPYIRKVRNSAFSESVIAYRKQRGISDKPSTPGILVQKMVQANQAGVAFSVDPIHPDKDQMTIMATAGLADRLVSGEINGDTYTVSRGGKPLSEELSGNTPSLTEKQLSEVAALCLRCEEHFGCPQDIEWAFEEDRLYLVQSRPITTLATTGSLTIWDNSNIVESYSGVASPLTFSFASYVYAEVYMAFAKIMGVSNKRIEAHRNVFANMLGFINGHVYYNLLNWYRALSLLPGFTMNRKFMEQMMGVREALPEHLVRNMLPQNTSLVGKTLDGLHLAITLIKLFVNNFTLPYQVQGFYKRLNRVLAAPSNPLKEMDETELVAHYRYLESELLAQWHPPLINDFMCMIAFGLSQKALKKWCGEDKGQSIHNDFMIGQGDIISAEPAQRIKDMGNLVRGDKKTVKLLINGSPKALENHAELKQHFDEYVEKFGDRCTQELKLESLTLHEDPTTLLQAIGFTAQQKKTADAQEKPNPSVNLEQALSRNPVKKWIAIKLVNWAKARVRDRENLRFERTRVFGRVRQVFLQIGQHFAEKEIIQQRRDIFYLNVHEILGAIEGTVTSYNLEKLVAIRRTDASRFEELSSMPNRFETRGAILPHILEQPPQEQQGLAEGDRRQGLGCCSGVVRAKVRVVHDPRTEALKPGEILVAKHTDPGWIALFSNASGIIVERGSLLSHSAIVAREMGIPAIVAISDIMEWLKTGDEVEMNGTTGEVVKINHEEA